jgi:3-methyl-2-oxobutanoate hydroxymethyltransferase
VSKLNIPRIGRVKVRNGDAPLVMVTAHDAPSARVASAARADMIMVGDTVAKVFLG